MTKMNGNIAIKLVILSLFRLKILQLMKIIKMCISLGTVQIIVKMLFKNSIKLEQNTF